MLTLAQISLGLFTQMKKCYNYLAVLLMVSGTLFVTSCDENDDDNSPISQSAIIGEWVYKSADISIVINDMDIIDYFIEEFEISEDSAEVWKEMFTEEMNDFDGYKWKFTSDNKYLVTSPEGNETGTWSLSSDNKKLTLTSEEETEVVDLKTLTSSKMIVFMEESMEEDINGDEVDDQIEVSFELELQK